MAVIDDRVVSMAFENSKFESGVRTTLNSLDKLKASLQFKDAGKGLQGISAAAKHTDLSPISRGIDALNGKFGALRVAGVAVLSSIAVKASQAGALLVKQFTLDPVIGGLHEYEGQIQSIQTILANTQAAGTNLRDVNKALAQLNTYADKTIYNFGQMTKNIGTFTAAGVDLETSVQSIKGISNIAALSGSSAEQASTAMYQLSQAIAAGRVSLQDWNSVVNAGMGGTVFKRALANTAVAMGKLDENAVTLSGSMKNVTIHGQSFRESIMAAPGKESWLSSKVLTNTLKQFSGELSKAELKAQGFSDAQIKAIQKQAKAAVNAATTVKTFSQLLDTTKEALGSGWAKTWQIIFGDFGEAKHLFTDLSNAIGGFVKGSAKARNSILQDWKDLGGRTLLIQTFKEAFQALGRIIDPIKKAFHDIFPPKTGKDLLALTDRFHDFVQILKVSPETVENIRRIFRGFFAVLDIGKQILAGVWAGIKEVFKALGDGSGNMLDFGGTIGDMIVAFRDWLKEGDKIKSFFKVLGTVISLPLRAITTFVGLITGGVSGAVSGFSKALGPASESAGVLGKAWEHVIEIFKKIETVIQPILHAFSNTVHDMAHALGTAIKNADFSNVFAALEVALTGGIFLAIKKALGKGIKVDIGQGLFASMSKTIGSFGGTLTSLSGAFRGLNGSLIALQNNIKANTLLQISIAIGILAASLTVLSMIKPKKLDKAMTAVTVSLGQLIGSLALLGKTAGGGVLKLPVIAASLIALATAIGVLSLSLLLLSSLNWEELGKGLTGVAGLLGILSIAVQPLSKAGPGFIIAGLGLTSLAVGLLVLAGAVKTFSLMDWESMAKGLAGVVASLTAVAIASRLISPAILVIGPGLIATGIGLAAVGGAVKIFASMDTGELARGIIGMAAALVAIGVAVVALPPTLPLTAAGLILVGIGLASVGTAIAIMGNMNVGTLVKGILAIGAALVVLAVGLTAMSGSIPGTIALIGATTALTALIPLIGVVGSMGLGTLVKGIVGMSVAILALGAAGAIATPGLVGLGISLLALGAGIYLISSGLAKLGGEGAKGIGIALAAVAAFVAAFPHLVIDFVKGIVEILGGIAKVAPEIMKSLGKVLVAMLFTITKMSPHFERAAIALIAAVLRVLRKEVPDLIKTGLVLIVALLRGIERNIGRVTKLAINIIIKFIQALTTKLPQLVTAGADAIAALLRGIANNIGKVTKAAFDVIVKFIKAIANGLPRVVKAGLDIPLKLIKGIGEKFPKIVNAGGEAIAKFIRGIGRAARRVVIAGVETATKFIEAVSKKLPKLADRAATAVINMLHAMANVIRKREPELVDAFFDLGMAVIEGLANGLWEKADFLYDAMKGIGDHLKDLVPHKFKILSPSKVMHEQGSMIVLGLANGITEGGPRAFAAIDNVAAGVSRKITLLTKKQKRIFIDLGHELTGGFTNALLGVPEDLDQVQQAFADMLSKIDPQIAETKTKIKGLVKLRNEATDRKTKLEARRAKLLKGDEGKKQKKELGHIKSKLSKENELIYSYNVGLNRLMVIRNRLLAGKSLLTKGLSKERDYLRALVTEYNKVSEQLDDATQALEDAKRAKDDAAKSIRDEFATLPEVVYEDINEVPIDPLTGYLDALKKQVEATKKYRETLEKLKAAGLDDTTYQKLLDEGVGGQAFADSILAGGQTAVDSINALDTQLLDEATILANNAADKLYQAGVDAAQGLVDGLTSKKKEIYQVMIDVADAMVKRIKKKLHIHSPSEVFAELGKFAMLGMARGLSRSSKKVTDAITGVSKDALDAMKSKMKMVSDAVANEIDPNPVIAPVLDLTDVQNGSKSLQNMMNVVPISAAASYGKAASISSAESAARVAQDEELAKLAGISFTQNNYSPEALSAIEVYRQTRNQLSQARPVIK